jgi:hypothetical protein
VSRAGMRRRGVGVVIAVAAVAVVVAVIVDAAPASSIGVRAASNVLDRTLSCRVRPQHYIDLEASVTLPPEQQMQRPAALRVSTVKKTIQRNGVAFNVPQVFFEAAKDSLEVDRAHCSRSSRRPTLKPTGLPAGQTSTPDNTVPNFEERCATANRVLVRFRITMKSGTPALALVTVRNDDRKSRPIAFFNWRPRKITGYVGKSCVSSNG